MRTLGPLVSSWSFEAAAQQLLVRDRNLIGVYCDEVTRQMGETVRIERPLSVLVRETASRFPEDQLPGIILECSGTIGDPERAGDGMYSASLVSAGPGRTASNWMGSSRISVPGRSLAVALSSGCRTLCVISRASRLAGMSRTRRCRVRRRWILGTSGRC